MPQKKSIVLQLGNAELMMAGMAAHAERLARRGIDAQYLERMTAVHGKALEAQNAKLVYKARMMEKNAERDEYLEELYKLSSEVRRMVKVELSPETWREFGIEDQR